MSDHIMDIKKSWLYHPIFPHHWKRQALYSLAEWVNGLAFRNIQFSESGLPVIKIAEIKGGISAQTKFTQQSFDESVRVNPGDMLFSWSGQPETSIDVFWWNGPEGWLNQHIFRVTPAECIDRTFFYYLLKYLRPNFIAIASNKQTTGLGHVTKRDLENIEVGYPDPTEQQAIACILGALDDKIELNRRRNRTLEAMARAIFQSWFVAFDPVQAKAAGRTPPGLSPALAALFPDRFEDSPLGPIPAGWRVGTVGDNFRLTMGQSPPGETYNEIGEGIPFYQGRTDFGFRFPNRRVYCTAPTRMAEPGDTLVSVRAPVGDVNIAIERCAVGRGVAAVRHVRGSRSLTYHGMHNLGSHFKAFEAEGTVFGSINKTDFAKLPFIESTSNVIEAFDRMVSPLDDQVEMLEKESRTLAALRDALLPKLISGELRVPDAERIVGRAM